MTKVAPETFDCMTLDDYAEWWRLNERTGRAMRAPSPCSDCEWAYRRQMTSLGLCAYAKGRDVGLGIALPGREVPSRARRQSTRAKPRGSRRSAR